MKALAALASAVASLALALPADAARRSKGPTLAETGVECHAHADPQASGETHWCEFRQELVDGRDFSRRNSRASYVVSQLGPDCEEIEILDEEDTIREDLPGTTLRRVSVACTQ